MSVPTQLEQCFLSPPEYESFCCPEHGENACGCEPDMPFSLHEEKLVVTDYDMDDAYLPVYFYNKKLSKVPAERVRNRSLVLCRDTVGKHVYRKLLWHELIYDSEHYPNGTLMLGFSAKVINGEQIDYGVVMPNRCVLVKEV